MIKEKVSKTSHRQCKINLTVNGYNGKKQSAPITGATEVLRFFSSASEIATTSEN